MIIEKCGKTKKFCDIQRGEVFEFDGDIFIKAREYFDINAVEIKTGNLYNIGPSQDVIIYDNAKVVLI